MRYRLRHLELDDKMCQQVSLEVFEQVYPRELVCEQLSQHHAWEERERVLNMFVLIHLSTSRRSVDATGLSARPGAARTPLAPAGSPLERHAGERLGHQLPSSAVGQRAVGRTVCPVLSTCVHATDPFCLPLWAAAGGAGWHGARCGRYTSQCGSLRPAQQSVRPGPLSANPLAPAY